MFIPELSTSKSAFNPETEPARYGEWTGRNLRRSDDQNFVSSWKPSDTEGRLDPSEDGDRIQFPKRYVVKKRQGDG
jgi:hypothetical protein